MIENVSEKYCTVTYNIKYKQTLTSLVVKNLKTRLLNELSKIIDERLKLENEIFFLKK